MKRTLFLTIAGILIALSLRVPAYAASSLQFSPTAKSVTANTQFTVDITIQADENVFAGNATVLYTASDLEFIGNTNGNFFDAVDAANDPGNGRVELHGFFPNSTLDSKSGSGTYATLTFKALRGSGTGTVSFSCPGDGTETFILKPDGTNTLSCGSLNTLTVTYGSTTAPSATPTQPPSGGPNPTATPTDSPHVNSTPSCTGISYLPTGTVSTFSTVTLFCQGTDSDGHIAGAQFDFGDGNLRIVTGDASDGKISTTYKYAKAGTYGVSCKVRDNSGAWSGIPEICKSKVTVVQGSNSSGSGSSGGTSSSSGSSGTARTTVAPTPTVDPYQQIVLADYVSPAPNPTMAPVEETPAEQQLTEENPLQQALFYLGGGVLLIAILIILARKLKGGDKPKPPVIMPPTTY